MCWDKNHRVLIAGVSQKQIKLFDLKRKFSKTFCENFRNALTQFLYCRGEYYLSVHTNENGARTCCGAKWQLSLLLFRLCYYTMGFASARSSFEDHTIGQKSFTTQLVSNTVHEMRIYLFIKAKI